MIHRYYCSKTFFYQGNDWNSLPDNIKSIADKNSFKSLVKAYLSTTAMNQVLAEYIVCLTFFPLVPIFLCVLCSVCDLYAGFLFFRDPIGIKLTYLANFMGYPGLSTRGPKTYLKLSRSRTLTSKFCHFTS